MTGRRQGKRSLFARETGKFFVFFFWFCFICWGVMFFVLVFFGCFLKFRSVFLVISFVLLWFISFVCFCFCVVGKVGFMVSKKPFKGVFPYSLGMFLPPHPPNRKLMQMFLMHQFERSFAGFYRAFEACLLLLVYYL